MMFVANAIFFDIGKSKKCFLNDRIENYFIVNDDNNILFFLINI